MSLVRRTAGVLLGLFVVWQIVFLLGANLLQMLDDARPHLKGVAAVERLAPEWVRGEGEVYAALRSVERVPRRWAELTGQPQNWSLFAPSVTDHIPFPAVELRWHDTWLPARAAAGLLGALGACRSLEGLTAWAAAERVTAQAPAPVQLVSDNEPPDRRRYLRWGGFRLRRYEGSIDVTLYEPVRDRPREVAWREKIESRVRDDGDAMLAYLRWRLAAFRRERPDLPPPKEVVLGVRTYRIPPPPGPDPWDWRPPEGLQPVARWLPGAGPGPGYLTLEAYNPVMERFEPLRGR